MPLDEFIDAHYKNAYAKFFNTLLKKHHIKVQEIIGSMHPGIDATGLINLGTNADHIGPYSRVFTQILKNLGYPIYY